MPACIRSTGQQQRPVETGDRHRLLQARSRPATEASKTVPLMAKAGNQAGLPRISWHPRSAPSPENRRRILAELYPESGDRRDWWFRFGVMMSLAVVVAVMGLSEDSATVVIGAMLIAPLMTPVLGIAAGLAMAWPSRVRQALLATAAGTAGAVAVAWALTMVLPSSDRVVTTEVLARTSPDLRDLFIGLAAGAAGAYATSREDVSAALPGVAVAVALVPPLATVGFTLAIGRTDLAEGAILLYLTNLVAIVLSAAFVFLATGFVPSGRRRRAAARIRAGVLALVVALVAVAVPLTSRSFAIARDANTTREVNEAALAWLSADPGLRLGTVKIQGSQVTVQVIGPRSLPSRLAWPSRYGACSGRALPRGSSGSRPGPARARRLLPRRRHSPRHSYYSSSRPGWPLLRAGPTAPGRPVSPLCFGNPGLPQRHWQKRRTSDHRADSVGSRRGRSSGGSSNRLAPSSHP